MTYAHKQKL